MSRKIHTEYFPSAESFIKSYHSEAVEEVSQAVQNNPVVVVGMAQNPVVKKARTLLDAKGIPYTYLEYGSYFSAWKLRLMIKIWSGWPTFPQIFVQGKLLGGCDEMKVLMDAGEFEALLASKS